MTYIIGSDPGAFHIIRQAGGPDQAMQAAGLYRKAMSVIRHGVNFVQLPLENIAEFQEPDLEGNMKKVMGMGMNFGIHGETGALGGEEIQLDSALRDYYIRIHQKVEVMLRRSADINSKYLLLHSSESRGYLQLGSHMQNTDLVDWWGRDFNILFDDVEIGNKLTMWAIYQKYIMEIASRRLSNPDIKENINDETEKALPNALNMERENKRRRTGNPSDELIDDEKTIIRNRLEAEAKKEVEKYFISTLRHFSEISEMSWGSERVAYFIVAKYLELKGDQLWKNVVNAGIAYRAKLENKKVEDWLKDNNITEISMDNKFFRAKTVIWFPAVSAKYLWGHFSRDENPNKNDPSITDPRITDLGNMIKNRIIFVIESPMIADEDNSRLPNPLQMLEVMKFFGHKNFGVAFDIEHILSANINPEIAFSLIGEGEGKYVRVLHVGWPSPLAPAHLPIPLGSEQQEYLYKLFYMLKQKGMGMAGDDVYIIFERGGGDDPYKQTFLALRNMVDYLKRDVPPENLPAEFYGISTQQILSTERQLTNIKDHALDPLKGLMVVPEEEHGVLGKAALEKGKRPEEWAKEKYK